jgi:proline dehydrogenase
VRRQLPLDEARLEAELIEVGRRVWDALPSATRNPLKAADEKAMELASQDAELKAALFRFVDVVPACRSLDDLARHLTGFLGEVETRPPPVAVAMRMGNTRAGRTALGAAAAAGVKHMAHRFIVGESPKAALGTLRELWKDGVASSVDLLGEATVTQAEAQRYAARCTEALETVAGAARSWPERPALERDSAGALPRANLSVKVSALTPLLRPDAPERGKRDAADRLRGLLRRARDLGAHLHIDMESLDSRDAVLELVLELLAEEEFRAGPSAGMVLQAYLRDSPQTLDTVLDWTAGAGAGRAHPLTVRLVKGAYWDHEVAEAAQHGWLAPVFEVKADSDRNFEQLTRRLLDARPALRVAIASHNLRSIAHAIACDRLGGGAGADLELQVLRGLGDPLQHAIAAQGLRVRTYCPVGDLVAGMAYLVRRLLENTSNDSFLADQAKGVPLEQLLAPPAAAART